MRCRRLTGLTRSPGCTAESLSPAEAVALLKDGVKRSTSGETRLAAPRQGLLKGAATGQWPYAAILGCIDSRAPVEQIFDAQMGDLFVGRVAGNVASPDLIASLECAAAQLAFRGVLWRFPAFRCLPSPSRFRLCRYATKYAGAKVVLVLGHTKCGAVKGAWAGLEDGHLTGLLGRIRPAVAATKVRLGDVLLPSLTFRRHVTSCLAIACVPSFAFRLLLVFQKRVGDEASEANIDACVTANVFETLAELRRVSPILANLETSGSITMLGGVYDVATGGVTFLDN